MPRGAYEIDIEACIDSPEKIRECLSCTKPRCNNCESKSLREKGVVGTDGDGKTLYFGSITEAAAAVGTCTSNIAHALKRGCRARGFFWRYAEVGDGAEV